MSDFTALLQNFRRIDGVLGVFLFDSGCEVIAEDSDPSVGEDNMAACLADYIPSASAVVESVDIDSVERHLMVIGDRKLLIEYLEGGSMLVICMTHDCSGLGRISLEIRKNKKNIESAMVGG